jgi:hypothetical protein
MNTTTRIAAGQYQHASGAIIERRGRETRGRNGYALPGWSVRVDGRETGRYATLAKASQSLDERTTYRVVTALTPWVASADTRGTIAVKVLTAVAARPEVRDYLASDVPTGARGELVHTLHTQLGKTIVPSAVEAAVKAAAVALAA